MLFEACWTFCIGVVLVTPEIGYISGLMAAPPRSQDHNSVTILADGFLGSVGGCFDFFTSLVRRCFHFSILKSQILAGNPYSQPVRPTTGLLLSQKSMDSNPGKSSCIPFQPGSLIRSQKFQISDEDGAAVRCIKNQGNRPDICQVHTFKPIQRRAHRTQQNVVVPDRQVRSVIKMTSWP